MVSNDVIFRAATYVADIGKIQKKHSIKTKHLLIGVWKKHQTLDNEL